ncbi:hypothetical protein CW751_13005 [Brumimicrobium salinarum]|uniref:Uncharacterized protein n=1 Tax=Brumimicrobium salinarum TaxID=2058658 RepID=A0A2I0QZW8_9FLAO|nr:hypothetical protein [Brumimicrobium salinarum]PKR79867.1 hypothetical protein CW751_13005 [Brumimicrobium salinarum]
MENKTILFAFILGIGLFCSCDQKEKVSEEKEQSGTVYKKSTADVFMEYENAQKMLEIENRIADAQRVESLSWEKQTQDHGSEFIQVIAYLNDDGFPMKITEKYIDGNFKPQGNRHFYLENNKLIAFKEQSDYWLDSNFTNYMEKRTVYNDEKPVMSQQRIAYDYTEVEDSTWKIIPEEHHSLKKVNKILSGTEEFETHFISVIKGNDLFLLLGEDKPQTEERYTTAVRVDEMTPFIEDLLNNLDEYKFRPVEVSFKVVGGNNQPEFRVLTDIAWKK